LYFIVSSYTKLIIKNKMVVLTVYILSISYFIAFNAYKDTLDIGVENGFITPTYETVTDYRRIYRYQYREIIEVAKNIYKEGRTKAKPISPNTKDCELLKHGNPGKFSCWVILENECYNDKAKCIIVNNSLANDIKFHSNSVEEPYIPFEAYFILLLTSFFFVGWTVSLIMRKNNIIYDRRSSYIVIGYHNEIKRDWMNFDAGIIFFLYIPMLILVGSMIHKLSYVPEYKFDINDQLKYTSISQNSNYMAIKRNNIKDYIFEGCPNNNWIALDDNNHDYNCHEHYGINVCCLGFIKYSQQAMTLMSHLKYLPNVSNYHSRSEHTIKFILNDILLSFIFSVPFDICCFVIGILMYQYNIESNMIECCWCKCNYRYLEKHTFISSYNYGTRILTRYRVSEHVDSESSDEDITPSYNYRLPSSTTRVEVVPATRITYDIRFADQEQFECPIEMRRPIIGDKVILFSNCGHKVIHSVGAEELRSCPLCRAEV